MRVEVKCQNKDCGRIVHVENAHKVVSPSKNFYYVCDNCKNEMYSYYQENSEMVRKAKKHGFTWSIEHETSSRATQSNIMYQFGFIPTHDGTVACEWKSPIWKNLSGQAKMFRTMEKYTTLNDSCGTHLNIGHRDLNIDLVTRYYHSLFKPFSDALSNNPQLTKRVFGRSLNNWAKAINEHTDATNHTNFVNVEHSTHLEFRNCKFINANQYMNLMRMHTKIVEAIINNFILNFKEKPSHETSEEKQTRNAHNKHKAQIAANKIVKIYEKFSQNVQ